MLQRDRDVSLGTRSSVFCPLSPKTGPHNRRGGETCPGRDRLWEGAEGTAGARREWACFLPVLTLGY